MSIFYSFFNFSYADLFYLHKVRHLTLNSSKKSEVDLAALNKLTGKVST